MKNLSVSEEIFDVLLQKLNNLVIIANNFGEITYINNSVEKILGFKPQELMEYEWWNLPRLSVNDGEMCLAFCRSLFNAPLDSFPFKQERLMKTKSGGQKWISWSINCIDSTQLVALGYDITELKQTQQNARDAQVKLSEKNKEITSSIEYALRLQKSILPNKNILSNYFSDWFVYYKPKDIVSGDCYFIQPNNNGIWVGAVDCTGHGVPGAMLSVISSMLLSKIPGKNNSPAEILNELDVQLYNTINAPNSTEFITDGMDIGLINFNSETSILKFSGARRPLLIVEEGCIKEIPGSSYSIGFSQYEDCKVFEEYSVELKKETSLYLFSDGFTDQFGGDKTKNRSKKLSKKRFEQLLLEIQEMNLSEQESYLEYTLNNWMQNEEQTDDILVIGLKV
ncbi:MAG: SpoIIE family protein phosphatase [Bacteroidia bacterium]|nr:SpoIIE family protein phosphatase [Bacteroidia bacterium]